MRDLADINREIADLHTRLNVVMQEREDVRQAEVETICAMFRAGKSHAEIAAALRMPKSAVQGTLYRCGLSVKARDQVSRQRGVPQARRYHRAGSREGAQA